jgi:hypothetical protein
LGVEIGAIVRDYNGAIVQRNGKGEIIGYKVDELSEEYKKKNIGKFGKIDKKGDLVGCKIPNLKSKDIESLKKGIEESNRRYDKWQQEQKFAQQV